MTDPQHFLDQAVANAAAQIQEFEKIQDQVEAIQAEAESYDRAVRVRVDAHGALLDIQLQQATARMTRAQLARLILETAQAAAQRASDLTTRHWKGVLDAKAALLESIADAHPETASLREVRPPASPPAASHTVAPIDDFSTPIDEFAPPPVDFAAPPTAYIAEQPSPQRSPWQKPRADAARPGEDDEDAHYDRFNQNPFGRH